MMKLKFMISNSQISKKILVPKLRKQKRKKDLPHHRK